jgi:hypothetical protein
VPLDEDCHKIDAQMMPKYVVGYAKSIIPKVRLPDLVLHKADGKGLHRDA